MRSLLDFLVKQAHVFLFILLEALSLLLLFGLNDRQNIAFMTSANRLSGSILEWRSGVENYIGLKRENERLLVENTLLRERLYAVSDSIETEKATSGECVFIIARVIDNSVRKDDNYITINKGCSDGVEQGMGVFDSRGVIGVVELAGSRYSLVLPVLNSKSSISCKVSGSNNIGFLEWRGGDPYRATVVDIPYHSAVSVGDTIVTSGYSSAFPENIPVGVVESVDQQRMSYTLTVTVALSVDMSDLRWVYVNGMRPDAEQEEIGNYKER
ncbi:MAG: rod shape-determining protein MreC [Bacteroidaceae bacterium]|nr:rod shape-determining protein MreC [Bacteroidaceae bacterium]